MSRYLKSQGYTLALEDLPRALESARNIGNSWKKCQGLAETALFIEESRFFEKVIKEALQAARQQDSPNRIATVAAWPLWVMVQRKHPKTATLAREFIDVALSESHRVRCGDALLMLFDALFNETKLRAELLGHLRFICKKMKSWKADLIRAEIVVSLAHDDPKVSMQILQEIENKQFQRRALREIEAGCIGPHDYFPYFVRPFRCKSTGS